MLWLGKITMKMAADIGIPLVGQRKISAVQILNELEMLRASNFCTAQEFLP